MSGHTLVDFLQLALKTTTRTRPFPPNILTSRNDRRGLGRVYAPHLKMSEDGQGGEGSEFWENIPYFPSPPPPLPELFQLFEEDPAECGLAA